MLTRFNFFAKLSKVLFSLPPSGWAELLFLQVLDYN
jgi:hypothetical protein